MRRPSNPTASVVAALVVTLAATASVRASGMIGIYGIVERVVLEPNATAPERIQVWGAFAYVDGSQARSVVASTAKRGYLYFKLPGSETGYATDAHIAAIRREWTDLKSVAGTGQAVGFGRWLYIASFGALQPDVRPVPPSVILENVPRGGSAIDLRVRPSTEPPTAPATYQTNAGIVKLSDTGSHASVVRALKAALGRRP